MQIGIAALGKGAQQVQCRRRLAVGLDHALRIGLARRGVKVEAVDDVAAIGRQGLTVLGFDLRGARLGELSGEPAELDDRAARAIGQHHRHLQQHLKHVADVVRVKLGKALGAVAALQQKGLARRHRSQAVLEPPRLAGEDEGRKAMQGFLDAGECGFVGISRDLTDREAAPAVGGPIFCHVTPSVVGGRSTIGDIRITEA